MVQRNPPLVAQLVQELAAEISTGDLVSSEGRLPSEAEIGERYSVSRATVRDALSKLELAGIIIRRHGVGTFVNQSLRSQPGLVWGWLDEAPAFPDLIARSGFQARTELLDVRSEPAGSIAQHLGLSEDQPVIVIEKIFYADDSVVIHSRNVLPCDLIKNSSVNEALPNEMFLTPIYEILETRCGEIVHHQTSEIRAVLAEEPFAQSLEVASGSPLLQVEEIGYNKAQQPLFYALHNFRGDQVRFRQIRKPTFTISPSQTFVS